MIAFPMDIHDMFVPEFNDSNEAKMVSSFSTLGLQKPLRFDSDPTTMDDRIALVEIA